MTNEFLKTGKVEIELDQKRYLRCSLYAFGLIEDKYGDIEALADVFGEQVKIKDVIFLLTTFINDGKDADDKELSEGEVARLVHSGNFYYVISKLSEIINFSISDGEKGGEAAKTKKKKM